MTNFVNLALKRGCALERLLLYLEENFMLPLSGCELNYSMLQSLLL